jgi:putative methyltransferase (TIGR04325 family)
MTLRARVRRSLPPALTDALQSAVGRHSTFRGPFATWDLAKAQAQGYETSRILKTVAAATEKVVSGAARYERDGVVFDRIDYSYPVLAALLKAACMSKGTLRVLDFGGSLGSSYRECRPFLDGAVDRLDWRIVEQGHYVEYGSKRLRTEELSFHESVADAVGGQQTDVVLLSSVLHYLSSPIDCLNDMATLGPSFIVVDRTIVNASGTSQAYVQVPPKSIYEGSYPVWSLAENSLIEPIMGRYRLLADFPSLSFPGLGKIDAEFKGYIFERIAKQ